MEWGAAIPGYLASVAVRSLGLAAAAGISLALLRVKSAAARHAVWTLVAMGMLLLAVLDPMLPPLPLRVLRARPAVAILEQPEEAAMPAEAVLAPQDADLPQTSAGVRKPGNWRIDWEEIATAIYLGGVLLFLALLALSYRFTRRLAAASRKVDEDVYESTWIAVPVTLGFLHPRILLPAGWREWPAGKLAAVMAHERTHVRRADWAIAVLADVNRCLFWFHPLAWWLERHLAALAEQAADDAALLDLDARESYAQTLLDMAAAVKSGRGRMVWEAMAMAKTAEVRMRIERILDETRQIPRGLTRARWALLAALSMPLVYLAAAVQLAPAQEPAIDREIAAQPAPAPPMRAAEPAPSVVFRVAVNQPVAAPSVADAPPAPQQAVAPQPSFADTVSASNEYPYPYRFDLANYWRNFQEVDPAYPAQAMAAGIEGDVQVRVIVGIDGRVKSAIPISGNALLTAAAVDAVKQWTAQPYKTGADEPVEVETTATVQFRLHPGSSAAPAPTAEPVQAVQPEVVWRPTAAASTSRPPVLLYKKEPEFPIQERAAGTQGTVVLSLTVDVTGKATNVQVTKSLSPLLDQNAVSAVSQWRFAPASQNGVPMEQTVTTSVNFRLLSPSQLAQPVARPLQNSGPPANPPVDSRPVILYKVEPVYPEQASNARHQGTVVLSALAGADAQFHDMKVLRSLGLGMDEAALEAVKQWKFKPAMQNGQPVDYQVNIEVNFRLPGSAQLAQAVAAQPLQNSGAAADPAVDTKPVLLYKREPVYPEEARKAGRQGTVVLSVMIGADAQVHNMKVTHSLGLGMDEAALEAVKQWKFKPATQNGQPVDYQVNLEVNFRL